MATNGTHSAAGNGTAHTPTGSKVGVCIVADASADMTVAIKRQVGAGTGYQLATTSDGKKMTYKLRPNDVVNVDVGCSENINVRVDCRDYIAGSAESDIAN